MKKGEREAKGFEPGAAEAAVRAFGRFLEIERERRRNSGLAFLWGGEEPEEARRLLREGDWRGAGALRGESLLRKGGAERCGMARDRLLMFAMTEPESAAVALIALERGGGMEKGEALRVILEGMLLWATLGAMTEEEGRPEERIRGMARRVARSGMEAGLGNFPAEMLSAKAGLSRGGEGLQFTESCEAALREGIAEAEADRIGSEAKEGKRRGRSAL